MTKNGFSGTAAAVLIAIAASGCAEEEASRTAEARDTTVETQPAAMEAPSGQQFRVAEIVGDPAAFNGRTVTVEADVEEVLTPQSFKLDEDAPLAGGVDNDLLVLYPKSANLADIDDQWANNRVRVTGTVRTVDIIEIEREIGWDLDRELTAELEDRKAVLIARTVERIQPGS